MKHIVVIGATGAIGAEFIRQFESNHHVESIYAFSRTQKQNRGKVSFGSIDFNDELSIQKAVITASEKHSIDTLIIATGALHTHKCLPEKSLRDLQKDKLEYFFWVNTIVPSLILKYFLPQLNKNETSICGILSARIGSISDNRLGGWYSYRCSKAALNMFIKTASVEMSRRNKKMILVGLHPGTVDSKLSKPFQTNVGRNKLFTPEYSVSRMLQVLKNLTSNDTGKCFAYDGIEITP